MQASLVGFCVGAIALAISACSSSDSTETAGADAGGTDSSIAATDAGSSTPDSGTTPPTDGASTVDGNTGPPKEFGEACNADAQCKSGACFIGGNGSYCSIKCTPAGDVSTDCPKPLTSGDCNNKGYCKR